MNFIDEYGVEFSEDRKTLLKFPKDQTTYFVPEGTETIGDSAFKDCDKLTKLCLTWTVKVVENNAFSGCKNLSMLEYIGSMRQWLQIDWKSWIECRHSLLIDDAIVTDLTIPFDVETIKQYAFYYCGTLKSVKFHDRVTAIGTSAFNKTSLSGDIILPNGLKQIGTYAFFSTNINNVFIPETIESIGDGSFSACYQLASFKMQENERFKVEGNQVIVRKEHDTTILNRTLHYYDTIIAFAGANKSSTFVVPSNVLSFAKDTFCFSTLGQQGIWIKHEMKYFPKDAFRDARGKVFVLPRLKPYYWEKIPTELLHEEFDQRYAFKSDIHKITAIADNPYRVLGVCSNASQKEITANARKIKRYLEVGKDVEFPTDLNKYLPPLKRTAEMVDKALADISSDEDKLRHAIFWFVNVDSIDEIALGHLQAGNIEKAKEIWEKKVKWSSLSNLSSLYLLYLDIDKSSSQIFFLDEGNGLLDEYSGINGDDFIRAIIPDRAEDFSMYNVREMYWDGLLADISLVDLRAMYNGNNIHLNFRLKKYYQEIISSAIQEAKNVNSKDNSASYKSMNKLLETVDIVKEFAAHFGVNDKDYELMADNFANQLLQAAINYYNSSKGDYNEDGESVAELAVVVAEDALEIATSQIRKDRCKQNLDILRRNAAAVPPKEILNDKEELEELLSIHSATLASIAQAYTLLRDAAPHIRHIKECMAMHILYNERKKYQDVLLRLSTNVVAMALNKLIKAVNSNPGMNDGVKKSITQAWEVILSMDNFPMQQDFKSTRYKENKDTLHRLFRQVNPYLSDTSTTTYKILEVRTDEEVWRTCSTIANYRYYIDTFKPAKHLDEATAKIRELMSKAEESSWSLACREGTTKAYEDYIKSYPNGAFVLLAKQKIYAIDDEYFARCSNEQEFKDYLRVFANGRHVDEAKTKIKEFEGEIKKSKKYRIERAVLIWLIVAFSFVILLTVIFAFCSEEAFSIWLLLSGISYFISLVFYFAIKIG